MSQNMFELTDKKILAFLCSKFCLSCLCIFFLFSSTSIFFGFVGWMMYILSLVLEDHSGVIRSKVKVDRLAEPSWKSDSAIRAVFLIIGLFITLLLLSEY